MKFSPFAIFFTDFSRRGNSKYHYYGIQVKSSSPLVKQMPFDGDLLPQHEFDIPLNMSPNEYIFSPSNQQNTSNSLTDFFFPNDPPLISNEFSMEDIKIFQKTHDEYSTKLYQVLIKFQYDSIEKLIEQFWSLTNIHHAQSTDPTNEGNRNIVMIDWNEIDKFRFYSSTEISSNLYLTIHSRSISFILSEILSNINRSLFSRYFHPNTPCKFSFSSRSPSIIS